MCKERGLLVEERKWSGGGGTGPLRGLEQVSRVQMIFKVQNKCL